MAHAFDKAFELISAAHGRGRLAHAFLICGDPGSGKEKLAARVVELVNGRESMDDGFDLFGETPATPAEAPPLDELESGWVRILRPRKKSRQIGVDEIRELEHTMHMAAPEGSHKVGVVVDADRLTDQASNAFLKTLEEPPDRTLLLLLTANPQRLLPTILSRCVRVPLLGTGRLPEGSARELATAFTRMAKRAFGSPIGAMQMKGLFTEALAHEKDAATAAAKLAEKEEVAAYKDATDGSWLKTREDFHKAMAEAEYLDARSRLLDVLTSWMADLLRVKSGATAYEFPESGAVLSEIAERESELRLLQRVDALGELRRALDTNAFEPLAIDVGFLKAFG